MFAADWHGGQASALYALASSGAIVAGVEGEIRRAMDASGVNVSTARVHLSRLLAYVESNGERGPQAGWSELRW